MIASRAALGAAFVLAMLSVAALTGSLVLHERARARWALESARLGDDDYSSVRSDALYREVGTWRARARVSAWVAPAALAALVLVTLAGRAARSPRDAATGESGGTRGRARREATHGRLALTTAIDGLATTLLVAAALAAGAARTGSPALDDALSILTPTMLGVIAIARAASGETPGTALTRIEHLPWPPLRAPLVVLALPLALALPVTALVALGTRRAALLAPHLAVLGVLPVVRERARPAPGR